MQPVQDTGEKKEVEGGGAAAPAKIVAAPGEGSTAVAGATGDKTKFFTSSEERPLVQGDRVCVFCDAPPASSVSSSSSSSSVVRKKEEWEVGRHHAKGPHWRVGTIVDSDTVYSFLVRFDDQNDDQRQNGNDGNDSHAAHLPAIASLSHGDGRSDEWLRLGGLDGAPYVLVGEGSHAMEEARKKAGETKKDDVASLTTAFMEGSLGGRWVRREEAGLEALVLPALPVASGGTLCVYVECVDNGEDAKDGNDLRGDGGAASLGSRWASIQVLRWGGVVTTVHLPLAIPATGMVRGRVWDVLRLDVASEQFAVVNALRDTAPRPTAASPEARRTALELRRKEEAAPLSPPRRRQSNNNTLSSPTASRPTTVNSQTADDVGEDSLDALVDLSASMDGGDSLLFPSMAEKEAKEEAEAKTAELAKLKAGAHEEKGGEQNEEFELVTRNSVTVNPEQKTAFEASQRKEKEAAEIQAAAEQRRNSVIASADQIAQFAASQQKKEEAAAVAAGVAADQAGETSFTMEDEDAEEYGERTAAAREAPTVGAKTRAVPRL